MNEPYVDNDELAAAQHTVNRIKQQIKTVIVGQDAVIDQVIATLLAAGHVLLEGVPGLGKTLLVKALARCFDGDFNRIQFTPDLMPSDVTGHTIYDMKTEQFIARKGPAFTHLLLADEINRAPAKTQAALLEVMQEKQITLEGKPLRTPLPYMVLATQNPIEQEGTYSLPEAELDRFMVKVLMEYPSLEEEIQLAKRVTNERFTDKLDTSAIDPVVDANAIIALQKLTASLPVDDVVVKYAAQITQTTRHWPEFKHGAGPRATIALIRLARAMSLLEGKAFVTPSIIKTTAPAVLRHRITLTTSSAIEGQTVDNALNQLLDSIDAPRL